MKNPLIFNIQRFSLHDGGGIRTTVFCKGCPLHCPWCSNPEGIFPLPQVMLHPARCIQCSATSPKACFKLPEACPAGAKVLCGRPISPEALWAEVKKDIAFFEAGGGVTFSGGEPLLFPEFLARVLAELDGIVDTAVETCGNIPPENLAIVSPAIDTFLFDLKILDRHAFDSICGGDLKLVLSNFEALVRQGKHLVPRVPLIPSYTDGAENLRRIGHFLSANGLRQVHLLPFHQMGMAKYEGLGLAYSLGQLEPPNDAAIQRAGEIFAAQGIHVVVGGGA